MPEMADHHGREQESQGIEDMALKDGWDQANLETVGQRWDGQA